MYKYTLKKELRIRKKLRNYLSNVEKQDNMLTGKKWLISDHLKNTIRRLVDGGCDKISFSRKIENDENGNDVAYYDKFFNGIIDGDIRITINNLESFTCENNLKTKIETNEAGEPMRFIIYF